jgi:hypothetical protein
MGRSPVACGGGTANKMRRYIAIAVSAVTAVVVWLGGHPEKFTL